MQRNLGVLDGNRYCQDDSDEAIKHNCNKVGDFRHVYGSDRKSNAMILECFGLSSDVGTRKHPGGAFAWQRPLP